MKTITEIRPLFVGELIARFEARRSAQAARRWRRRRAWYRSRGTRRVVIILAICAAVAALPWLIALAR